MTDQVTINLIQAFFTFAGLAITTGVGYMVQQNRSESKERAEQVKTETVQVRADVLSANAENYRKMDALLAEGKVRTDLMIRNAETYMPKLDAILAELAELRTLVKNQTKA